MIADIIWKQREEAIMARILVVDDEPEIRLLTRLVLEKAKHSVLEAVDGQSALRAICKEKPDVVLLDVMMPGPLGWEICKKIKECETTKNIPAVMFTVKSLAEDIKHSAECGAVAHIAKPFEKEELLGTIDKILTRGGPGHLEGN